MSEGFVEYSIDVKSPRVTILDKKKCLVEIEFSKRHAKQPRERESFLRFSLSIQWAVDRNDLVISWDFQGLTRISFFLLSFSSLPFFYLPVVSSCPCVYTTTSIRLDMV